MSTELQSTTLENLTEFLKTNTNVGTIDLRELIDGTMNITKSGKLKLPLSLPAEVVLESNDLRDVINGKWRAIPVLMFVHPDHVRDEDGNQLNVDESTDEG